MVAQTVTHVLYSLYKRLNRAYLYRSLEAVIRHMTSTRGAESLEEGYHKAFEARIVKIRENYVKKKKTLKFNHKN